jgi:hypothetical protein
MKKHLLFGMLIAFIAVLNFTYVLAEDEEDDPLKPKPTKPGLMFGPTVGYNRAMHSVDLTTDLPGANCPKFTSGNSNGFYIGGNIEFPIGGLKNTTSGIIAKLLYSTLPASMQTTSETGPLPVNDPNNTQKSTDVFYTNEVDYSMICGEVLYKFNFAGNLGFVGGLTGDFALARTQEMKIRVIGDNQSFSITDQELQKEYPGARKADFINGNNNPRSIILKEGEIANSSAFRIGLKAGIQYEFLLTKMVIAPHAFYNFGINNLASTADWRVSALQLGIDVRYAF